MMKNIFRFTSISQSAKAEIIYIVTILAIWVVMAILVNPIGDFPLNDDWAFGKAVQSVVEKGDFQLSGWGAMNLFSQVWWGALFCLPFGFSFTALRFSTLTLGLIGVLTTYGLLREASSSQKVAVFGALLVATNPIYFALSNTFMSDIPFFAFANLAILFLIHGLKRDSITAIVIGIIIACVSLLIRQLGMVIFLAFGFTYIFKKGIRIKTIIQGFLPTLLGLFLQIAYQKWLELTGRLPSSFGSQINTIIKNLVEGDIGITIKHFIWMTNVALVYLGLFIFPFIFLVLAVRLKKVSVRQNKLIFFAASAIFITLIGILILKHRLMPLSENILTQFGIGPLTLRDIFLDLNHLFALKIFWAFITVIGVVGAVVLILYFFFAVRQFFLDFQHFELAQAWLTIFVIFTIFLYFLPLGIGTFYDRYLIWLIPLSMMFISASTKNISNGKISSTAIYFALLMLLFSGIFTIGATHDYLSWNRVRWQALNNLMQKYQILPSYIDGGFEFNGWYLYNSKYQRSPDKSSWWVDRDDYIISFGSQNGYEEVKRYSFSKWLPVGPENILVLHKINQ